LNGNLSFFAFFAALREIIFTQSRKEREEHQITASELYDNTMNRLTELSFVITM